MSKSPYPMPVSRRVAGAAAAVACSATIFCSVPAVFHPAGSDPRPSMDTTTAPSSRCAANHDISVRRACEESSDASPVAAHVAAR